VTVLDSLWLALRQLAGNKLRTALTSLGVLIGVAAVITMVDLGRSATAQIDEELSSLGEDVLFVQPGDPGQRGPPGGFRALALSDVRAIRDQVHGVARAGPFASRGVVVRNGEVTWRTTVQGVTNEFVEGQGWSIAEGRPFTTGEELGGAAVCIIGQTLRDELFGSRAGLDRSLRVGTMSCTVVGITTPRGENTFGVDQDDFVMMPFTTFQRRITGNRDVQMILVGKAPDADPARVKQDLTQLMRDRRHVRPGMDDDFVVRDLAELQDMISGITGVLTGLLASIAAVSLLVGGIGIMNIMTVSVTERTREIGIRLAVGALRGDVLFQFLVEAVVLSVLGGAAGVVFGVALSFVVARALQIPPVVDPAAVGLAFVVSAGIGVVFGYWPARRAARMEPIDALRHE